MLKKICILFFTLAVAGFAQDDFDSYESDESSSEEISESTTYSASAEENSGETTLERRRRAAGGSAVRSAADEESQVEEANNATSRGRAADRAKRREFEKDQRLDEFANNLRRRDWLKDRLVFEIGMGSRQPVMGETGLGMGFGFGAEYITRWHLALYGAFGFIPSGDDPDFSNFKIEGGTGWKVGLNYYLFPKNPLHLGLSVSYGTVYYDHDIVADSTNDYTRKLLMTNGFQFDVLITYLTNEWYYLQFAIGMYYAPNAYDDSHSKNVKGEDVSRVIDSDGISKFGLVFGITIGFALPEFFPDATEIRRREREKKYSEQED